MDKKTYFLSNIYTKLRIIRVFYYIKIYGLFYVIRYSFEKLFAPILVKYYKKKIDFFKYNGKIYRNFYHKYTTTWANERMIEIPIIYDILTASKNKNILEVGNVLKHYYPVNHDIVDKYEDTEGIIKEDILNYNPSKKYDLIISISTFEHIGWDEEYRNPAKIFKVIDHLKKMLTNNGIIIFTIPINYNPVLDEYNFSGKLSLREKIYFKRKSKFNWEIGTEKDAKKAKYGKPYFCANVMLLGKIKKK